MNKQTKLIQEELFKNQDLKYKSFCAKLTPTLSEDFFIGVRNPITKSIAKRLVKENNYKDFISSLPHRYYEENMLHGYILSFIKDYDYVVLELNRFLPYIDNWAVCDCLKPICFKKNKEILLKEIDKWLKSKETYTIRFGVGILMDSYLDEDFDDSFLKKVSLIKSEEYYVNMMIAWYFATALAKQYDQAIIYLEKQKLSKWVHNKTIQKAIESYRISDKDKDYLRTLKIYE